jgi:hypothetical protein
VIIASLQGLRNLIFSWSPGNINTMSVPAAGANDQDLLLIGPGLVFDKFRDLLPFHHAVGYNVTDLEETGNLLRTGHSLLPGGAS